MNRTKMFKNGFLPFLILVCMVFTSYAQHSDIEKLRDSIRSMTADSKFSTSDTLYIHKLQELSNALRFYDQDSMLVLAEQSLEFSQKNEYSKGQSIGYMLLANYYSDSGQPDRAINNFNKALTLANDLEESNLKLRIINNLANEYAYKGNYAKSLTCFLDGIELATQVKNGEMLSIMYENAAQLYGSQKEYDQALEFFNKVKRINDTLNNQIFSAETYSNLASLYADMGELDYAMFHVNRSITTFEKARVLDWLAYAYETKGKIYLKEAKFKWALYWYKQSEMLHDQIEDDRGKIDLLNGMAEAYIGQENDSLAEAYAQGAFKLSKQINSLEGIQKCAKTLYVIEKNKRDFSRALGYHELYQKIYDSLSRNENKKVLTMYKTKSEYEKQKAELMFNNEQALARQSRYLKIGIFLLLTAGIIILLVYRSKKIQQKLINELNAKKEKLEQRKAQLKDSNETKTKLFSIIGHDLRGPIGALQDVLKMFTNGDLSQKEFLDFVPKFKEDINHISFTLNNLLSWGYSQMNGSVTKPAVIALDTIVRENIHLLSEIAEKKSIKLVSKISDNTLTWSDPNQIDIVIRNLISNSLKFTPENGMVTVSAMEKDDFWEIAVRDTGVGMDKNTQEKLFQKNANITTYGTNNEKGTGLGLSLCKEMVEKNNGTIRVESALRKGTCFYFTLPKASKKYSKAS